MATMSAPIAKDSVVGVVDVYSGEILVGSAEIVAAEDIEPNFVLYSMKLAQYLHLNIPVHTLHQKH